MKILTSGMVWFNLNVQKGIKSLQYFWASVISVSVLLVFHTAEKLLAMVSVENRHNKNERINDWPSLGG